MGASQSDMLMEDLRARREPLLQHFDDLNRQLAAARANHLDTDKLRQERIATMITLTEMTNQLTELMRQKRLAEDGTP